MLEIIFEKLGVPIIAGLFGLLPIIFQWISQRSQSRGKNYNISRLSSELEFLERWTKLNNSDLRDEHSQEPRVSPQVVQQHLDRILAEYSALREMEPDGAAIPHEISFVRRLLLLFRPLTRKAWVIHTAFYFLIIFITTGLVSEWLTPIIDPDTGETEFTDFLIGALVMFGLPLLFLRRAALRNRENEQRQFDPP